jgi:putative Holliday junction resolvase
MSKKYLCIDVGLKRIGVALGLNSIAVPYKPIIRINRNQASLEVLTLIKENNIDVLVVGIPFGDNENIMATQRRIRHFVSLINFTNIEYVDESSSSVEAREMTKGIMKHKKDAKIDSLSAKIILDRYLN